MLNTLHAYRQRQRDYVSEFTQFMQRYQDEHPEALASQRKGWYIFWDKKVDLPDQKKAEQDSVPTPPYYYP